MVPIEISSPHSYTHYRPILHRGHNTQRGRQMTDRAMGKGRLCCSIGGQKKMRARVDLPSSTRYVEGSLGFSRYTSMHYIIGQRHVGVAVNSPMRFNARSCMNVFATSNSKYYRRSRCGITKALKARNASRAKPA